MRIFLIGIIICFNGLAGTWSDLEQGVNYKLTQDFQLTQVGERSGSMLDFIKGESYSLKEIMNLPIGFPLTAFIFRHNNCPGMALKTDVDLVTLKDSGVIVGAILEDCELSVYVEGKDYYTNSLFE